MKTLIIATDEKNVFVTKDMEVNPFEEASFNYNATINGNTFNSNEVVTKCEHCAKNANVTHDEHDEHAKYWTIELYETDGVIVMNSGNTLIGKVTIEENERYPFEAFEEEVSNKLKELNYYKNGECYAIIVEDKQGELIEYFNGFLGDNEESGLLHFAETLV